VAFGAPANGKLTCGPAGTMVYTPNKWFSGTDQFQVTTTDAVKLYAVDTPPLATVGGVDIQSSANGSAIAAVPGKTDEIYGMTDRGPDVDGRTDTEKVLPIPDFHPQIAVFQLTDGTATPGKTIILKGSDGERLVGLVDPQANIGESLVTIDGRRELSLRSPNQGMEGLTITPDGSTLVGIMQSALKTPGLEGSAKSVPLARIVTVNMATKAVKEYLYPLANPAETKVALSEITALSDTQFLVDERDGELQPLWQQEDLHR
jgi:Esterase-like activity of phytase/Bacterial Ig domain